MNWLAALELNLSVNFATVCTAASLEPVCLIEQQTLWSSTKVPDVRPFGLANIPNFIIKKAYGTLRPTRNLVILPRRVLLDQGVTLPKFRIMTLWRSVRSERCENVDMLASRGKYFYVGNILPSYYMKPW